MIRGVIFDMDGVLIEAKDWHYDALNKALRLFGHEISRADHLTTFDGLPTRRKLEILSVERSLPRALHGFINDLKQQYTMEIVHLRCRPRFIHEFALARLKAEGKFLGVASNSIRKTIELMMEKSALSRYLDTTVSNQEVVQGKPDPAIYLLAMERLGLKPSETLIVEDNDHGVRAAIASGAHLLRVEEVTDVRYDTIAARIAELEAMA
jgi:HAD superfamily hydrolase (TIGR01509 family)